jgi:hypothetical protein
VDLVTFGVCVATGWETGTEVLYVGLGAVWTIARGPDLEWDVHEPWSLEYVTGLRRSTGVVVPRAPVDIDWLTSPNVIDTGNGPVEDSPDVFEDCTFRLGRACGCLLADAPLERSDVLERQVKFSGDVVEVPGEVVSGHSYFSAFRRRGTLMAMNPQALM